MVDGWLRVEWLVLVMSCRRGETLRRAGCKGRKENSLIEGTIDTLRGVS